MKRYNANNNQYIVDVVAAADENQNGLESSNNNVIDNY